MAIITVRTRTVNTGPPSSTSCQDPAAASPPRAWTIVGDLPLARWRIGQVRRVPGALQPGSGRSSHCEDEDQLRQRLDSDGVIYGPSDLPTALSRLEPNGDGALIHPPSRMKSARSGGTVTLRNG
jgi:hypothetical protein